MSTGQNTSSPLPHAREKGFSIIETLVGMTLMFVGLLALASSTVTGMTTKECNREAARATSAARQFLETMQTGDVDFGDLVTAYMTDVSEAVPPTDPRLLEVPSDILANADRGLFEGKEGKLQRILAREFDVVGLEPRKGKSRSSIGGVSFPVATGVDGPELREDIAGRDLNADGVIDSENHIDDYKILPVTVRVEWDGVRGPQQLEVQGLLIQR